MGMSTEGGDAHSDDRAQGVDRVHRPDRAFTEAAQHQSAGDERQGDAGAEGGGDHDQHADPVAGNREAVVARLGLREGMQQVAGPPEGHHVDRERRQGEKAHRPLGDAQDPKRVGELVGLGADPERSHRDTENERRQHELEGVSRTAHHQRQHPDPGDLIDE
jgi:hypothetical protein